jgi:steroid 5-alpha reductase family enzyme
VNPVLAALLVGALTVLASMTAAALRARQLDKAAVVDVAWGAGFVLIALTTAGLGTALDEGDAWRTWLATALVAGWGLRLAWHVRSRAVGEHAGAEDPRYAQMLGGPPSQVGMGTVVRRVFLVQGVAQWFIAVPVMIGAVLVTEWRPVVVAGVVVWCVGFFFETVGDRQLAAYKATPRESRPQVMDQGLWRYTRHPNYFGDACIWWGLWLIAGLGSGWVAGLATIACPAAMTYFIHQVTGAKLLEKTMMQRPGYPEYAARTSMFFPLPPKKAATS